MLDALRQLQDIFEQLATGIEHCFEQEDGDVDKLEPRSGLCSGPLPLSRPL